jgi:hypothetical protein
MHVTRHTARSEGSERYLLTLLAPNLASTFRSGISKQSDSETIIGRRLEVRKGDRCRLGILSGRFRWRICTFIIHTVLVNGTVHIVWFLPFNSDRCCCRLFNSNIFRWLGFWACRECLAMRRRTGVATAMRIAINRFYFDLVRCEWNEPVELKCLLFGSSRRNMTE